MRLSRDPKQLPPGDGERGDVLRKVLGAIAGTSVGFFELQKIQNEALKSSNPKGGNFKPIHC